MSEETLPADLLSAGYKLTIRESQNLVSKQSRDPKKWRTYTIQRRRYILISSQYGVGVGLTMAEAIQAARDVKRMIEAVKRKQAEELAHAAG